MNIPSTASSIAIGLDRATAPPYGRALPLATFVVWLFTASVGAYMLTTWLRSGGLRRRRDTGEGPPTVVIFGHFGLAISGLVIWGIYVVTGWAVLAWVAAFLLMPAVGLGIATVTLWTPYPGRSSPAGPGPPAPGPAPAGSMFAEQAEDAISGRLTDEMLTRALTDEAFARRLADMVVASVPAPPTTAPRKQQGHFAALVPAGHGIGALTTILLVMMTVASAR